MERIDEESWKPIPEGGDCICHRKSVYLHVTLRAKIKYLFASVLRYRPLCDAPCTIVCLTTRTIPLCRRGWMIITKYLHARAPFPSHRSSVQVGARNPRLQSWSTLSRHFRLCKNNAVIRLSGARHNRAVAKMGIPLSGH
jgi:hypothetical protein